MKNKIYPTVPPVPKSNISLICRNTVEPVFIKRSPMGLRKSGLIRQVAL